MVLGLCGVCKIVNESIIECPINTQKRQIRGNIHKIGQVPIQSYVFDVLECGVGEVCEIEEEIGCIIEDGGVERVIAKRCLVSWNND